MKIWQASDHGSAGMKIHCFILLCLLLGDCLPSSQAQEATPGTTTNTIPNPITDLPGEELQPPGPASVATNKLTGLNKDDLYHLDTTMGYRRPLNGDYDWLTLATLSFGKMLDQHNSLDAVLGGGVVQLKAGSQADAQAHQPFFVELGIAWQYHFITPETSLKPYITAGASLVWMSWEYRSPVDSKDFGFITRDYLEGIDGYAGAGLRLRLRRHLNLFGEIDVGGIGYLSTTYSGVHNNLFANFGYVGARGGLSLTF